MKDDHDHDRQRDGAQNVRAIFAAQTGEPIAKIFDPRYSPLDPNAEQAHALRRALAARGEPESERATIHRTVVIGGASHGKSKAMRRRKAAAIEAGHKVITLSSETTTTK